jgi:y4mF family transcriptional regulator
MPNQMKPPQIIPIGKTVDVSIKTPEDLGSLIRERRKKAKLTQKKAAALAGVGVRFLSELERGKPTAQIGKTLKVAQLLGLELRINERR